MYLIPGILGFLAFYFFDINKIRWQYRPLNLLFPFGALLLLLSTLWCIPGFPADVLLFEPRRIASLAGLLISGFALVYVLFFALPFESTYTGSDSLALVDRGAYALCRHPGFWMFAAFYFFLWRYFTGNRLFAGFLLYTACNFLYVYVQDKYIFPQYIQGYEQYRHNVPFLLPTRQHIKNAFLPKRA